MLWSASAITILNLLLLPMNLASINQQLSMSLVLLDSDLSIDVSHKILYEIQLSQADIGGWLSNRVMTVLWRVVAVTGWHAAVNHHDHSFAAAAPELGTDHR